jgi:hypothetical protein
VNTTCGVIIIIIIISSSSSSSSSIIVIISSISSSIIIMILRIIITRFLRTASAESLTAIDVIIVGRRCLGSHFRDGQRRRPLDLWQGHRGVVYLVMMPMQRMILVLSSVHVLLPPPHAPSQASEEKTYRRGGGPGEGRAEHHAPEERIPLDRRRHLSVIPVNCCVIRLTSRCIPHTTASAPLGLSGAGWSILVGAATGYSRDFDHGTPRSGPKPVTHRLAGGLDTPQP